MKIEFFGAAGVVTGSSYLLETKDFRLLIDCGMFQGSKAVKELNYGDFPYDPRSIDAVILTHAHIDHSGLVPKLIKAGYDGPIYATPVTVEFCSVMLPDSGHIQEMEIERKNRKRTRAGLSLLSPIYTAQDGIDAIKFFRPIKYGEDLILSHTISAQFLDAGHILGSSHVVLSITEEERTKKIVFSGDIGTVNQPYIKDPTIIEGADLVIIESTYGSRNHMDKSERLEIFAEIINSAQKKGGNIIIPAFAVERTQDILFYLQKLQSEKKIPTLPVYIDSPLAVAATKIFRKNTESFDAESTDLIQKGYNPLTMENLNFSETTEDSIRLNTISQGAIIISASGMADAGRIKHHLKHNLWRSNATIIFVGYQAEGTLGRRLIDGVKEVTIHGENITVNANIQQIPGFSGHADQSELLRWVTASGKKAENIILIHGEDSSLQAFSSLIERDLGIKPLIPVLGERFEFINGQVLRTKPEKPWLELIEEKITQQSTQSKDVKSLKLIDTNALRRKPSRPKRNTISEVNQSYNRLRRYLKIFVNSSKRERDYSNIIDTFNKIINILQESNRKN